MGVSAPQTFRGITPERYAKLTAKARSAGIPLEGNSGTAAKFGIEVSWDYSPASQELTIQCLRTPFFLRSGEVDAKIRTLIEQGLTA